MFVQKYWRQRKICFLTAAVLGSVVWMWSRMPARASGETVITHIHTGSSATGGGCYTRRNIHVHEGDSEAGGGCYTVPVYHSHTGSAEDGGGCYTVALVHVHEGDGASGGGCYTAPVYHSHTGSSQAGGGCYTAPVYHGHTGSSQAGGGCYTAPVYHRHTGDSQAGGGCYTAPVYHSHTGGEASYPNGCYTQQAEKIVTVSCGTFLDDGDGYWRCHRCGVRTPHSNVPYDKAHKPQHSETVYVLGCGKSENVAERYLADCGKDEDTLEGYEAACGMSGSTVVSYQTACGKSQGTIEGYVLQCGKAADGYAPGCGRTEQTVEGYETGCRMPVTYSPGCGYRQGESLGSLEIVEREGGLYVETEGIAVEGYLWSDGSQDRMLTETKPGTAYSCVISYMDGTARRSVELTAKTEEERMHSGGWVTEEGTIKELLSDSPAGQARILKRGLEQRQPGAKEPAEAKEEAAEAKEDTVEVKEDTCGEGELTVGELVGPAAVLHGSGFPGGALAAACVVSALAAAAVLFLLWSRCAILYCYDDREHYRILGLLSAGREKDGYHVRISGRKLERGTTRRYRIAVNRWLRGKRAGSRFVVETDRQKLNLVLEEYVDFAL